MRPESCYHADYGNANMMKVAIIAYRTCNMIQNGSVLLATAGSR